MPFSRLRWLAPIVLATLLPVSGEAAVAGAPPTPSRFTVVDEGTPGRPDVILIPGLTSSRAVWAGEAARLRAGYRLHLVQLNGFGDQPAGAERPATDLLPAIVEQLHTYIAARRMRPVVVGHSLGGLLGLMLAKAHPEDVNKLVVVDALPFVGLMFGPQATVESVAPAARAMHDAMLAQDPAQREAAERRTAETLARSDEGRDRIVVDGLASDPAMAAEAMSADFATDLRPDLAAIRTPTLVLYAFDPTLTFPNGMKPTQAMADAITTEAYRAMPNAKLVRIDGSRHFIMFDQPNAFARELEAFIAPPAKARSPGP